MHKARDRGSTGKRQCQECKMLRFVDCSRKKKRKHEMTLETVQERGITGRLKGESQQAQGP